MTTFSVITPSFQQCQWLRLAAASISDQSSQNISVEHLVQDSVSTDGTADFLNAHPEIKAEIAKDSGMYDALNRGFQRAEGEILSYLNCDEQYLPGALETVADFFQKNPETEMLFTGWVVVDGEGKYLCSRRSLIPQRAHTQVCHLSPFTCSIFFRRSVLSRSLFFDANWKALGDAEWMIRCIGAGVRMAAIPDRTSVFTEIEGNLGGSTTSELERIRLRDMAPVWERWLTPLIATRHRVQRWLSGIYRQTPFEYAIYTQKSPQKREVFQVAHPTTLWQSRFTLLR